MAHTKLMYTYENSVKELIKSVINQRKSSSMFVR